MNVEQLHQEMTGQPVRSLQVMLRRLAQKYPFLPQITPDGLFGSQTREAVMAFQQHFYPPVNGVVNQGTWEAIRRAWLAAEGELADPRPLRAFPSGQSACMGERKLYLYPMQAMFLGLGQVFDGLLTNQVDGCLGTSCAENIRWLQRRCGLTASGVMDCWTWDMLARLYEVFVVHPYARVVRTGGVAAGLPTRK